MALPTRPITGKAPWPFALITGPQKKGKTHQAAVAAASPLVDRTFWFTMGEDAPDDFLNIDTPDGHGPPRIEVVQYDGTYRGLYQAMQEARREPMDPARPHLWVNDSGTKLWELLTDMAQQQANARFAKRQAKLPVDKRQPVPEDGVTITPDLWNTAKDRWYGVVDLMRKHAGPSIMTARLEEVNIFSAKGDPTGEKMWKVQAQKSIGYDVDVIVEAREIDEVYITGVRSSRFKGDRKAMTRVPDFTFHQLWTNLGLADAATIGERSHISSTGAESQARDDRLVGDRNVLLEELKRLAAQARITASQINQKWVSLYGHPIDETTDLGALELFVDDFRARFITQKENAA